MHIPIPSKKTAWFIGITVSPYTMGCNCTPINQVLYSHTITNEQWSGEQVLTEVKRSCPRWIRLPNLVKHTGVWRKWPFPCLFPLILLLKCPTHLFPTCMARTGSQNNTIVRSNQDSQAENLKLRLWLKLWGQSSSATAACSWGWIIQCWCNVFMQFQHKNTSDIGAYRSALETLKHLEAKALEIFRNQLDSCGSPKSSPKSSPSHHHLLF